MVESSSGLFFKFTASLQVLVAADAMAALLYPKWTSTQDGTPELAELGKIVLLKLRNAIKSKLQRYNFDRHTLTTIIKMIMPALLGAYKPRAILYDYCRVKSMARELHELTVTKDTSPYNPARSHRNVDRYGVANGRMYTVVKYNVRAKCTDQEYSGSVHVFMGVIRPARSVKK